MDQDTKSEDKKEDQAEIRSAKIRESFEGAFIPGETSVSAMAMESSFEKLVSVRWHLDRATDALNVCIEEFEQRLRLCNPGISAWVDLELGPPAGELLDDDTPDEAEAVKMGFYRTAEGGERGWHLVVVQGEGVPVRLIRASRRIRVAATRRFRDLVNQLAQRGEKMLGDVEAATKRLQTDL